MHKSWGNAIEFDEAADRMGVDVMRWMFAKARPEDNILFGWHAADEARRELLVLWNVYAFFVTYARLAGVDAGARHRRRRPRRRRGESAACSTAGSCPGPRGSPRTPAARLARRRRAGRHARDRARSSTTCPRGTCAGRATGCAPAPTRPTATRRSRRSTRRWSRLSRTLAPDPAVPVRRRCTGTSSLGRSPQLPDSVHLTPLAGREMAGRSATSRWSGRWRSSAARSTSPGRSGPGRAARPASRSRARGSRSRTAGLALGRRAARAVRATSSTSRRRGDRRRLGARRAPGQAAAAEDRQAARVGDPGRDGRRARGRRRVPRRRLGDAGRRDARRRTRSRSRRRRGRARRSRTTTASSSCSTRRSRPALRAEGDARELQRAIQDLRKDAGLELDDRIELWVDGLAATSPRTSPSVARRDAAPTTCTGRRPPPIADRRPGDGPRSTAGRGDDRPVRGRTRGVADDGASRRGASSERAAAGALFGAARRGAGRRAIASTQARRPSVDGVGAGSSTPASGSSRRRLRADRPLAQNSRDPVRAAAGQSRRSSPSCRSASSA